MPFILDEEGNDLITTQDGSEELQRIIRETTMQDHVEPQSMVKAYVDGILTIKPGDIYYSLNVDEKQ